MTSVSIAMAVYNGERFLQEQLDSFVRQTRLPDELVVSDNASTDRTVGILRGFAAHAPFPVRIFINDRNLGVSKNFERAIQECTGDIIFLSDCDDVWYSEKIRLMDEVLSSWPTAAIAICNAEIVNERAESLGTTLWTATKFGGIASSKAEPVQGKQFRRTIPVPANCMAFRGKFKTVALPLPENLCDRFIAWTIVYSGAGGVALLPQALLGYRQHSGQVTRPAGVSAAWPPVVTNRANVGALWGRFAARKERPVSVLRPLIQRLEQVDKDARNKDSVRSAALRHWRARCDLATGRIARLPTVVRELASLRYHRFSSGLLTAVKDLIFVE